MLSSVFYKIKKIILKIFLTKSDNKRIIKKS